MMNVDAGLRAAKVKWLGKVVRREFDIHPRDFATVEEVERLGAHFYLNVRYHDGVGGGREENWFLVEPRTNP